MANEGVPYYTGKDFAYNVAGVTAMLRSFRVTGSSEIARFKPLEDTHTFKSIVGKDVKIVTGGVDSKRSGAGAAKALMAAWMNETPPSAIEWENKAATPVSNLPDDFFDDENYPLLSWRIIDIDMGTSGANDPSDWTITLEPNF